MISDMIKFSKNLIPLAIVIAGLIIGGAVIYSNQRPEEKLPGIEILSPQAAAEKAINLINQNILEEGVSASLIDVVEENGLYKIRFQIQEQEIEAYLSLDGKLLFTERINLEEVPTIVQEEGESQEILKRDIPDVKLFVMSYCPYGLQAMKMFLPVYDLLKDKAEMGIYFVDYIMHEKKEIDENLRQYCIQKEENEKYSSYLSCFVKDGNFDECLSEAKISRTKLESCISETDKKYEITAKYNDKSTWLDGRFPKFDVHSELDIKYGVGGSPTIVINDKVIIISPRSPEKFKETICQAFSSSPQECSQTLSLNVSSFGFGEGDGLSNEGSGE